MSDQRSDLSVTAVAPPDPAPPPGRAWWLAAGLLATAAVLHFTLVAVSLLPDGAVPSRLHAAAQAWVAPLFVQSWWLFAPDPPSLERVAEVRGIDGDGRGSAWLSLTAGVVRELSESRLSPRDAEWIVVLNATYALADPRSPAVRLQGDARALALRAWRAARHQPAALVVLERAGAALLQARARARLPDRLQIRLRIRDLPDPRAPAREADWTEVEFLPVPFPHDVAAAGTAP